MMVMVRSYVLVLLLDDRVSLLMGWRVTTL